jgi:hypothetical protein
MTDSFLHLADVPNVEPFNAASTYLQSFAVTPQPDGGEPRTIDWAGVPGTGPGPDEATCD